MKKYLFLFLIFIYTSFVFGQNDYFKTDSSLTTGRKLLDNGDKKNSKYCEARKGDLTEIFSPSEVEEYGFKDGRVYVSKNIGLESGSEKVFLLRLVDGKNSLYYFKNDVTKLFFLEKDSNVLIPISKVDSGIEFNQQLQNLTGDCQNLDAALMYVSYTKQSLSKFIEQYNTCERKPFPHFRYGITLGYESAKLKSSPFYNTAYINELDFNQYDKGMVFGIFVDQPINASDFSLHSELYYSEHNYSYKFIGEKVEVDFDANFSNISVPVLLRYTFPSNKFRPFINAGGLIAYNVNGESTLYITNTENMTIETNVITDSNLFPIFQLGISFGGGLECVITPKHSLFFDVRYNNTFPSAESVYFSVSSLNFTTGFNF